MKTATRTSCSSGLRSSSRWIFQQTKGQSQEVSLGNSLDQWPMTTLPSFFSFFILLSFHTHIAILILTRKRSIVRILNSVGDRGRHNRGIHNLSGFHMHRQTSCLNTYGTALITFHVLFSSVCVPETGSSARPLKVESWGRTLAKVATPKIFQAGGKKDINPTSVSLLKIFWKIFKNTTVNPELLL